MPKLRYNWLVTSVILALVGAFLAHQYYRALAAQSEEAVSAGAFLRYLLGLLIHLATALGLAHLHYRWVFRPLHRPPGQGRAWYWASLGGLACLVFAALQAWQELEPALADESVVVALLATGGTVAYAYLADAVRARRDAERLLRERSQAELDALKAQLNPHFLFNALNTLYNRAGQDGNEALADLIQQLAGLLRFTLTEAQQPTIGLDREIGFLEQYIALQRARLPVREGLRVSVRLDWDELPTAIAPLLLLPLIENAFQYGISLQADCWIEIDLDVEAQRLHLRVANRLLPPAPARQGTGQGLANVRRRLALLYPGRHQFRAGPQADRFEVALHLDLRP
jgi:hypothetical protein